MGFEFLNSLDLILFVENFARVIYLKGLIEARGVDISDSNKLN